LELARTVHLDIPISDVTMPEMTGIELAIAVSETAPGWKILLFSGQGATRDLLEKALHRGHDFTILTKPVHPTDMLRHISECLERRKTSFEPIPSSADNHSRTVATLPN
jgi:DNA-binding NtrC family response regulator